MTSQRRLFVVSVVILVNVDGDLVVDISSSVWYGIAIILSDVVKSQPENVVLEEEASARRLQDECLGVVVRLIIIGLKLESDESRSLIENVNSQ